MTDQTITTVEQLAALLQQHLAGDEQTIYVDRFLSILAKETCGLKAIIESQAREIRELRDRLTTLDLQLEGWKRNR